MLKYCIILIVLIDGFLVLKIINFKICCGFGSLIIVMCIYEMCNVDEMVIFDIDVFK